MSSSVQIALACCRVLPYLSSTEAHSHPATLGCVQFKQYHKFLSQSTAAGPASLAGNRVKSRHGCYGNHDEDEDNTACSTYRDNQHLQHAQHPPSHSEVQEHEDYIPYSDYAADEASTGRLRSLWAANQSVINNVFGRLAAQAGLQMRYGSGSGEAP